ncbi:MAG: VWA domain-containing protein [Rhodothermales bacterium]
MMEWLHPEWFWTLVFVPVAAGLFGFAAWKRRSLVAAFGNRQLLERLTSGLSTRRRRWKAALLSAGFALLVLALIGPRFGTQIKEVQREGIDLVIALDVSASMMAEDVAPNRLERSRNEIKRLLGTLTGDRVGLVIFAGDAFIQSPLTTDYGALRLFLDVADPSLIPTPGTDFGNALQMALRAFEAPTRMADDGPRTRAVLFVSDGENHVADLDEIIAQAREQNVILFAAGVGETEGVPIPEYRNGRQVDFKKDRTGTVVTTRLEESVLQDLSRDGGYFRIARTSSSLARFTTALQGLERTSYGSEEFEEYDEKFQWPLFLGLFLLFLERMIPESRKPRETPSP